MCTRCNDFCNHYFCTKTFFGSTEIYTMDERKAAASLIKEHINSKEGCMLFLIKYEGDTVSKNNLDYCNELAGNVQKCYLK